MYLLPSSPSHDNILQNYSTISQPGYWHWYSQDTENPITSKVPQVALSIAMPTPFLTSIIPGNEQSALHFYNSIISKMLYKQNYTLGNIWGWVFFTQHNFLEIYPNSCVYHNFAFSLLSGIPWCDVLQSFNYHLIKDIWILSSFWVLQIKLL